MSFRWSRRAARRGSRVLLALCAAILAVLWLVPAVRESDLSVTRMSSFRIPKRKLAPFARQFESKLPVLEIVIAADSIPEPGQEPVPALMRVFDRPGGNRLTDPPTALLPFVRVRHRGASSMHSHYRQHSIRLNILDEKQKPSRFNLCGFPPDDDFVLIATCMDRSLIRDRMAYELARPLMPFTPRAKFVEVFARKASDRLDERTYSGIYLAMEQIEEGPHRLDNGPLEMADSPKGLEGGGWALQHDRPSSSLSSFRLGEDSFTIVGPGSKKLTPEAADFIREDFARFQRLMKEDVFSETFFELLDVDSLVNMVLFQEFIKNVDAFQFSTYFYRRAGGRLVAGPPWDFNLTMGNARDLTSPEGFTLMTVPYSKEWMKNPRFFHLCQERWRELRQAGGAFSDGRILDLIDAVVAEVEGAAPHHFGRYQELLRPERQFMFTATYPVNSFEKHVRIVRDFLLRRAHWMDGALAAMKEPGELFSGEAEQAERNGEAAGTAWWKESESPPLRRME